ncbi:hypothetical protein [Leisingera sp. M523]|uniref:hypothetical protein n=1 Tax=Leisingera sp. M523 TaxID=2867013 RepID=UPI0021A312F2|nr:hypothetical protein [Leisingera sp. M523]UWQ30024.1 hypothetical protein K3557_05615 [Leisingera sp. M523]
MSRENREKNKTAVALAAVQRFQQEQRDMTKRLLTYAAAFLAGFLIWVFFTVMEAMNPFLPWQYPALALFTGMSFPGGATPGLHFLNHVAETWFPFLAAFLAAKVLTRKRARFLGALTLYAAFLVWSLAMAVLVSKGVPLETIFTIGLLGTLAGGAVIYLRSVDPIRPSKHPD